MNKTVSYLSLGSNMGNREAFVLGALRSIEEEGAARVGICSDLYETSPVEVDGHAPYVNAVAEIHSLHNPEDLLKRLKTIEKKLGRTSGHNRPREIDIDIISYERTILNSTELTLPHPRYAGRAFVLLPLREIAPDFKCPLTGRDIGALVDSLPARQRVIRISGRNIIHTTAP